MQTHGQLFVRRANMASVSKKGRSFSIRVSCGYDIRGKQIVKYKTFRPPEGMSEKQAQKEANRQAVLFEEECKIGHCQTGSIKFEAFAEQWFKEYAKLELRPTTYERMRKLTTRVYPAIGHLKLDKISRRDIKLFINDLALNGRNFKTGEPLSRKTIIHHVSFISDVFSYAIDMDMLTYNPCEKMKIPHIGEEKEREIYSPEEFNQLFELLQQAPLKYRVFFTLAVFTGFRRGELLGLEWKDILWEENVISVRRTSAYTGAEGQYTGKTKTKRSQRCNRYPDELFELLKEYKVWQDEERERQGEKWIDTDRLFTKWDGRPMNPQTPYGWYKEFCQKHDFRFCNIHSMRHSHASILIAAGVDVATVSADLGHSNCNTTLGIYTHEFAMQKARTSDIIGQAINFQIKKEQRDCL